MKSNIKPVYKNIRYRMVDSFQGIYRDESQVFLKPGFSPEALIEKIYDQESWHVGNVSRVEILRIYKPNNDHVQQNIEGYVYMPLYAYNPNTRTRTLTEHESKDWIEVGIVNYAFKPTI